MYFTVNPFFYYLAHQENIEKYLKSELQDSKLSDISYIKLRSLVELYINENSHGVDKNKLDSYIDQACKSLCNNS